MGTITVSNLGKAYKQYPTRWSRLAEWVSPTHKPRHTLKWVLQDINFTMMPGEAVGIIGINGAGKSTLLKMITGTTQPTVGSVNITGRVAALLELGMGFHPDFTGRQNAYMAGQLLGMSAGEIANLMSEIETFAEIGDYLDQPVRVYSSGMQVRLAFSVATAHRPDVLIIDEALSVGDIFFQQKCFARIKEYKALGTTLLFVSHDAAAISALCDKVLFVSNGVIAHYGEPKQGLDLYLATVLREQHISAEIQNAEPEEVEALEWVEELDGSIDTGRVEIKSSIRASNNQVVSAVTSGDEVTLVIQLRFLQNCSSPSVGFTVTDAKGLLIYGTRTSDMNMVIDDVKAGELLDVRFTFKAAIQGGDYTVDVGVAKDVLHKEYVGEIVSFQHQSVLLRVMTNRESVRWGGQFDLLPNAIITKKDKKL
jgi:lipopolysaccharide transport system ATP-binding protein